MIYFCIGLVLLHQLIVFVIAVIDEDRAINFIALTNIFMVLFRLISYPFFAIRKYNKSIDFYRKQGISKVTFLFGKRSK